ncbi:GNAT family protein [Bacillus sp. NEB1478]|uniref:GNAT family N-acetyltransferase n=1 Tax=Bacillus sp. NEB1478 TaxID=3073816 RepID=UPI002873EC94|nr:GNAT family protein [Bacillus sp. NEB1478]WNB90812.1 GNAT family protein [Bacillus sp. NEB1478]
MNSFERFPVINTDRLTLRPVQKTDAAEIFSTFSDAEALMYYGMEPLKNEEEAFSLIEAFDKGYTSGSAIRWGITLKDEDKLIGTCGFHNWSKTDRRTELGYELNRKYWSQGYMIESLQAILHFGFNSMAFNRVAAVIRPENASSRDLVNRLGFTEEALLKEYQKAGNDFYDMYVYSLLKKNAKFY